MKVLYRNRVVYKLNDFENIEYSDLWYYGELPKVEKKEWSFDELGEQEGFHFDYSLFSGKPISVRLSYYYTSLTKRKEFICASTTIEPREIDMAQTTFKSLIEHLALADYVEWCKDNNIAPIVER